MISLLKKHQEKKAQKIENEKLLHTLTVEKNKLKRTIKEKEEFLNRKNERVKMAMNKAGLAVESVHHTFKIKHIKEVETIESEINVLKNQVEKIKNEISDIKF